MVRANDLRANFVDAIGNVATTKQMWNSELWFTYPREKKSSIPLIYTLSPSPNSDPSFGPCHTLGPSLGNLVHPCATWHNFEYCGAT